MMAHIRTAEIGPISKLMADHGNWEIILLPLELPKALKATPVNVRYAQVGNAAGHSKYVACEPLRLNLEAWACIRLAT
jgi:hypothetical protein